MCLPTLSRGHEECQRDAQIYQHIMIIKLRRSSSLLVLGIIIISLCSVESHHSNNQTIGIPGRDTNWQSSHRNIGHVPMQKFSYFTDWSEWSVCDRHCSQNRVRICKIKRKCGTTVLREERSCYHKKKGRRRKCSEKRGKDQNIKEWFHIFQLSNEAEPRQGGGRRGKKEKNRSPSYYGKWSKWSPCTRSCTTQRHRWCRKPGICGRDVIRESAYCYVEGSFCQKWINRRIRGSHEDDNDDTALDEFELNPNTVESLAAPKNYDSWKCGVVGNEKISKLSYFTRIIGGHPTVPGNWPWQVAILNRFKEAFCGGTLVSPRWILTAAHCIRKRLYVRLGEHDLTVKEGTELEFRVDAVIIHPEYDVDTVDNDVALLRLPVTLNPSASRGIACLPSSRQPLPTNKLCTIIGWGKSRATDDFGTDVLHEAKIPIVSIELCKGVYVDYQITDNMFCAGYQRGRMDSCAGDSGGPLLCRDSKKNGHPWTIFGITSFGEGCGKRGKFGIYANLPNYVNWITKVMEDNKWGMK